MTDEVRYLLSVSSRKKNAASDIWQFGQQTNHLIAKAHFKTLIKLVDNKNADLCRTNISLVEMIVQTTRCTENHLWANLT